MSECECEWEKSTIEWIFENLLEKSLDGQGLKRDPTEEWSLVSSVEKASERVSEERKWAGKFWHVFFFERVFNILSIINPIVANNGHYEERKPRG